MFSVVRWPRPKIKTIDECISGYIYIRWNGVDIKSLEILHLSKDDKAVWFPMSRDRILETCKTQTFRTLKEALSTVDNANMTVIGFENFGELHQFLVKNDFYNPQGA